MTKKSLSTCRILILAFAATLSASPAFADKPSWAGGGDRGDGGDDRRGKHERRGGEDRGGRQDHDRQQNRGGHNDHDRQQDRDRGGRGDWRDGHFDDGRRGMVRDYYAGEFRSGRCPPGLAKKHNGCMPPGQARKWAVGRPLPQGVMVYDLPPALVVQLGHPPAGYRYVRAATDILLIAVGTGMVVDAIQDLGGF